MFGLGDGDVLILKSTTGNAPGYDVSSIKVTEPVAKSDSEQLPQDPPVLAPVQPPVELVAPPPVVADAGFNWGALAGWLVAIYLANKWLARKQ